MWILARSTYKKYLEVAAITGASARLRNDADGRSALARRLKVENVRAVIVEATAPSIEPEAAATALVVLLHGYGATGAELMPLAEAWRARLPQARFVAPDAPQVFPDMPGLRQWFPLSARDPHELWRGVTAARPALESYLDAELIRCRLGIDRLALVGFSQGAMMALHVGLRLRAAPAAVVGFSGLLAGPMHLAEITVRPPVLLIHGAEDDVIPAAALHSARQHLTEAGVAVAWHVRDGVGHAIDPVGERLAGDFLVQALRQGDRR